jgi:hypothetical protein
MAHIRHQPTTVASWNANGLRNKTIELQHYLKTHKIKIVLIQETHLKPSVNLFIPNFQVHRTDRPGLKKGGGTAILVHQSIQHHQILTPDSFHIESTAIQITTNHGPLNIISAYLPPAAAFVALELEQLLGDEPTLLAGDLNATHKTWNSVKNNRRGNLLYKLSQESNFIVAGPAVPTHSSTTPGAPNDVLDLAVFNHLSCSIQVDTILELSSDHFPIHIQIGDKLQESPPKPYRNYNKADWNLFRNSLDSILGSEPETPKTTQDIDILVNKLTNGITKVVEDSIPETLSKQSTLFDLPPGLSKMVKAKNHARKTWQRLRTEDLRKWYNHI